MTELLDTEKLRTYFKRYEILDDKLKKYLKGVSDVADTITRDQFIYHIEILNQVVETQASILEVCWSGLNNYSRMVAVNNNVLRLYAREFGSLHIMQRDALDGAKFRLDVTMLPLDENHSSIEVNSFWESENEYKHNRRRSYYKKIRDGITFFRQSLRKP